MVERSDCDCDLCPKKTGRERVKGRSNARQMDDARSSLKIKCKSIAKMSV